MHKKLLAAIRYFTLTALLLAALSLAACGQTPSGQNTFLSAEAGEVEVSGTALKVIELNLMVAIDESGLKSQYKSANMYYGPEHIGLEILYQYSGISYSIENLTITKHTDGEGSFTFNLVLKKDDKVLSLPLSATYGYTRYEETTVGYRDQLSYIGIPYTDFLTDGRLAVCSYGGVFIIDPNTLAYEKLEFERLPIEAPFVIKGVQLGRDGKFTLLATDKVFDYIIKLDENKEVDGYKKITLDYKYLYGDEQTTLLFGLLVAASDNYEYMFSPYTNTNYHVYYDGKTDEYFKVRRRSANEQNEYSAADKMIIYRTPEELGFGNYTAVAAYNSGESIRFVKFDGNRLDGAFETLFYKPRYSYGQDTATYFLAPDFLEVEVDFAADTARIEYNFTKDMLAPAPFAISSDKRYELYAANYTLRYYPGQISHVVMYDTSKKEITYLSAWLYMVCPQGGNAGFFKNDDIYLQQFANLFVFNPETAGKGPAQTLNLLGDFGLDSRIHTFRRDPDDKSFTLVYSAGYGYEKTYAIAFYSADGKLINSVPSDVAVVHGQTDYVELSISVSGKAYTVKGYDDNDKLVVHFEYTVGDTSIINRI